MGGGGKSKEEIQFEADVLVQRILEDGLLDKVKTEQAYMMSKQKGYSLHDVVKGYNSSGFYQFSNWRNFARWYSPDSLPDYGMYSADIPEDNIKNYIYTKEGTEDIDDFSIGWSIIKVNDWVMYRLQELIDLDAGTGLVNIDGKLFLFKEYKVNTTSATNTPIDAILNTVTQYKTTTNVRTETNIIPLSETEDTKVVTTTEQIIITFGSITLSDISKIISKIESTIPKDSEVPSIDIKTSEEITTQTYEEKTIVVNPQPLTLGYIASYVAKTRYKLFIYYPTIGNSPEIGQTLIPSIVEPYTAEQSFEAVPTVLLRSNFFSLDEYSTPVKTVDAGDDTWVVNRPDYINEKREYESDRILNSVGLNLNVMLESINENPDINKISDAYMTFGVAPTDQSHIVSKALFLEFDRLYNVSPNPNNPSGIAYQEQPYNQAFSWDSITKETKDGVITKVFEYKHNISTKTHTHVAIKIDSDGQEYEEITYTYTKLLTVQYQLSENKYIEITVDNLQYVTVVGQSYRATITIDVDDDKDRCIFPVTAYMLDNMTPLEMVELLERSFHIVFYAAQLYITELEWYQTGIFQTILQIVGLIIMIVGAIYGDGGSVGSVIMALAKSIAIGIALQLAFTLISQLVQNPYLKAALMAVATIAATYAGGGNLSLDSLDDVFLTAVKLVDIASTVWAGEIQILQEELMQDKANFNQAYNEKMEDVKKVQDMYNANLITSEFLAELNSNNTETIGVVLNPSAYYSSVFSTATSYDLLFSSGYDSVNTFYDNKYDYYLDTE